jgi:hypothetical protein
MVVDMLPIQGPLGIGVAIALAELAYGAIKYHLAVTPSMRREAVEEFYGVALGAVVTSLVAYYMTQAQVIAASILSAFGVKAQSLSLTSLYGTMLGDFHALMGEYILMQAFGIALSIVTSLSPLPIGGFASAYNAIMRPYYTALIATMWNVVGLAAISIVLQAFYNYGIAPLSVALLLPRRTRRVGAWLASFTIVFTALLPALVAYQHALVLQYGDLFHVWQGDIEKACTGPLGWLANIMLSIINKLPIPSQAAAVLNDTAYLPCVIVAAPSIVASSTSVVINGVFYLMVGDIIIDIILPIGFAVTAWLASLIEAGAASLFEVRHV